MTCHSKRSRDLPLRLTCEKNSEWTSITPSSATTAAANHRPGWRTGTTVGASGEETEALRPRLRTAICRLLACLAGGAVDLRGGDRTLLHAPRGEDPHVGAIGHEDLDGGQERLDETAVLSEGEPVGSGREGRTRQLELPVGNVYH